MNNIKPKLSVLFGLIVAAIALWAIANELRAYNYRDVLHSLATIPMRRLRLGIGLTALGYLTMTGYDVLALRYIHLSLAYPKVAFTSFISYAASNTIGFALLTGSAVRYRFYSKWGLSLQAIAQIVAFVNFSFWLGILSVGGIAFVLHTFAIPAQLNLPWFSVRPLGIIFLLLIASYLLGSWLNRRSLSVRGHQFRFPSLSLAIAQIGLSSLDWSLAAAVVYSLLPTAVSYPEFLGIYLLAMTAGVISNIPGGLGVFESVIVLILAPQVSAAAVLGSLLVYRAVYYLLPLAVAIILFGVYEVRMRFQHS
ncbi:lysylphosphatidylglycerol synthase domain-containing protein [Chroogloeocystis siderophila]|uniref:Lysylphosphatidylglycerol synthetase n=1 Tax=Chroogloeocystis siderophila 5.2 s.c.1 TaxID=247279 RepID=A0A1U7HV70_9CHRO|nr:lysylphosphatidylglycerol synthase domain-containing protein [Chroogloeocystis siderophila]OKH27492.1 hypothetical protein NIES1031_09465 [Chroogloeocystis siderophila 5.2 s.c.1]